MKRVCICFIIGLIAARSAGADTGFTDNVVILLDASGSMNETLSSSHMVKLRAAKDALKEVLQRIPSTTHVGLLVFGGGTAKNPWVYPLGPRDDQRLAAAVEHLRADGATPLGEFMKLAGERLLAARDAQYGYGTYRLLIVTDGEAGDQPLVERYTPQLLARGIVIDVIGVGMKADHTLATKVQSYRRADDPDSLKRAVREVFAEVGGADSDTGAQDAFSMIAPLPDEMALAMLQAVSSASNAGLDLKTPPPGKDAGSSPPGAPPRKQPGQPAAPGTTGASGTPVAPTPPATKPGLGQALLSACCGLVAVGLVVGGLAWAVLRRKGR